MQGAQLHGFLQMSAGYLHRSNGRLFPFHSGSCVQYAYFVVRCRFPPLARTYDVHRD